MIIETDLVYATAERQLLWDIYRPDNLSEATPAVIILHGGGWRMGSRRDMADACAAFVRQGFTAIAPEYRLLGEVAWPAPLEDVERCISAAISQADRLRVIPGQLFLAGYSAGAHLSLLAAAEEKAVTGVAAFFPLVRIGEREAAMLELANERDWAACSPINFVDTLPPTTIFASDGDEISSWKTAFEFHSAIRAAGGVADFQLYNDLPHEFVKLPGMMDQTVETAAAFFTRTGLKRAAFTTANEELRAWWRTTLSKLAQAGNADPAPSADSAPA